MISSKGNPPTWIVRCTRSGSFERTMPGPEPPLAMLTLMGRSKTFMPSRSRAVCDCTQQWDGQRQHADCNMCLNH